MRNFRYGEKYYERRSCSDRSILNKITAVRLTAVIKQS